MVHEWPRTDVRGHSARWRWRESNPRPLVQIRYFSGRSHAVGISTAALRVALRDHPVQLLCGVPHAPVAGTISESPSRRRRLARRQRQVDGLLHSLRQRGRSQCAQIWHLLLFHGWLTRSPWLLGPLLPSRQPMSKPVTPCVVVPRRYAASATRARLWSQHQPPGRHSCAACSAQPGLPRRGRTRRGYPRALSRR